MPPYQQRVVDEKRELDTKIDALYLFLGTNMYSSLPSKERVLLNNQFNHMVSYSGILAERIANFNQESN